MTTSGLFSLPPVMCTVQVLGVDRVLFSVDYPFGSNAAGRALLDTLPLAPRTRPRSRAATPSGLLGPAGVIYVTSALQKSLRWLAYLRHNDVVKNVRLRSARPTRGQVARLILELGPSTAATLGGRLGLTPAAIRRHLDNLLAEGLSRPGRPGPTATGAAAARPRSS